MNNGKTIIKKWEGKIGKIFKKFQKPINAHVRNVAM